MPPVVCDVTDIVLQPSTMHGYQGWATQHRQIGASLRVVIPVGTTNGDAVPLEFLTNPVDFYLPKRSCASCQSPRIVTPRASEGRFSSPS
jgi:predicted nucleotidyltransferase